MIKKIKRFFNLNIIQWVFNTQIEYTHLESNKYLLVENSTEGSMLFTKSQVKIAKERAQKQSEDV